MVFGADPNIEFSGTVWYLKLRTGNSVQLVVQYRRSRKTAPRQQCAEPPQYTNRESESHPTAHGRRSGPPPSRKMSRSFGVCILCEPPHGVVDGSKGRRRADRVYSILTAPQSVYKLQMRSFKRPKLSSTLLELETSSSMPKLLLSTSPTAGAPSHGDSRSRRCRPWGARPERDSRRSDQSKACVASTDRSGWDSNGSRVEQYR